MVKNPKFLSLHGSVEALSYEKDTKQIYYRLSNRGPSAEEVVKGILATQAPEQTPEASAPPAAVPTPAPVAAAVAAPVPSAAAPAVAAAPSGGAEVNAPPCALDSWDSTALQYPPA